MSTPTSPGWYEDPEDADQLRYFDGVVWSAHTTPLRSPTAASSTIGHAPTVESAAERAARAERETAARRGGSSSWSAPPVPSGTAAPTLPDGAVLAQWWRRLLGRAVDWLLTTVVSAVLLTPFLGSFATAAQQYFDDVLAGRTGGEAAFQAAVADIVLPVTLVTSLVGLLYEVGFLVWRSATPGKMALGTVVRPVDAPGGVSLVVALRRQAIALLTAALGLNVLLGYLGAILELLDPAWLLWDPRRQCLHDKVAGTVVVLRS
ncbi:RDD family protein [Phycicoccus flavus]|uniref:RDD family protein n=1 Tax=Phycicoccus flavus TaxID=2502783 RepID=A0A8T6R489_9MICO|nr:RDD family protein [Phycicoccus flavus]NHA68807.1 RDD family protein [Phycicoccus flavus]